MMLDIVLAGVSGQGIVLAAKVLAVAAASRGWEACISETVETPQRGQAVSSHVRIADDDEAIYAPLATCGTADLVIAFEPGEAARALPLLAPDGAIITATTPIPPASATLNADPYDVEEIIKGIQLSLYNRRVRNISHARGHMDKVKFIQVNDKAVTDALGGNRKVLNSVMLAAAAKAGCLSIATDELIRAVKACVKPEYAQMNVQAIELVMGS